MKDLAGIDLTCPTTDLKIITVMNNNTTTNKEDMSVYCEPQCEELYRSEHDDRYGMSRADDRPYDGGGWAGDGSGTDDFADYNQNEGMDY